MVRQRRASAQTPNPGGTAKVLTFDDDHESNQMEAIPETVEGASSSDSGAGDIVARSDADDDSEEDSPNEVSDS